MLDCFAPLVITGKGRLAMAGRGWPEIAGEGLRVAGGIVE